MVPAELKYTDQHEWLRQEGEIITVGITHYAQEQLTDVVFVEVPEVGRTVTANEATVVLESVKSVEDVYSPVAGEIVEVNKELKDHPEKVNEAPYGDGWLFKVKCAAPDTSGFMDAQAYQTFLDAQE